MAAAASPPAIAAAAARAAAPARAAIFDMDGLLLGTEALYTRATEEFLRGVDASLRFPLALKRRMMGLPARDAAALFVREMQLDVSADEYARRREALQDALWPSAELMPGARALLEALFACDGVKVALATSSYRAPYALKTTRHRALFARFDAVVCGDDAHPDLRRGKPAPDIFLVAARLLGVAPADCVVFEDSEAGVAAARAAGMRVVWVPHQFALKDDPDKDADLERVPAAAAARAGAAQALLSLEEFDVDSLF